MKNKSEGKILTKVVAAICMHMVDFVGLVIADLHSYSVASSEKY